MINKNQISLFLATLLLIGFFIIASPNQSFAGLNLLCCTTEQGGGECIGCGESGIPCAIAGCQNFISEGVCEDHGDGVSCNNPGESGCCVIANGQCRDGRTFFECNDEGIAYFRTDNCSDVAQCAPLERNVPTLSQWGLIAIAGILGIIGLIVIRRRQLTTNS